MSEISNRWIYKIRLLPIVVEVVKPGERPEHVSLRGDLFFFTVGGKKKNCSVTGEDEVSKESK